MIFYEHIFNFKMALMKLGGKILLDQNVKTIGYNPFRKGQVVKSGVTRSESLTTQQPRIVNVYGSVTRDTK